jgi:hypothetical protein
MSKTLPRSKKAATHSSVAGKATDLDTRFHLLRQDIRDEFEHRIASLKSETQTQYKLDAESLRVQQKRYFKIALGVLAFLGLTSIGGIYTAFNLASRGVEEALDREVKLIQSKISQRLDTEFQTERIQDLIGQTAKKYTQGEVQKYISHRVDSAIIPVQSSLNLKLKAYDDQLSLVNSLVDIYELESSARNGSRSSFEKLATISDRKNDRLAASARNRIAAIKNIYSILRYPQGIMIGDVSAVKNGKPVSFDSLTAAEMIFLLNDKNASLDQIHKMMTHAWSKPANEITAPLVGLLKSSDNLAACVAACSMLSNAHGQKADIFDFNKWVQVLQ